MFSAGRLALPAASSRDSPGARRRSPPEGRPGQQDAEFPANALVCEPTPQPPTATSHARPFPTPWTPASLSAFGFSRAGLSLSSVPE